MQALSVFIFAMLFDYVWPARVDYNILIIIALLTKVCIPIAIKKQEKKKKKRFRCSESEQSTYITISYQV